MMVAFSPLSHNFSCVAFDSFQGYLLHYWTKFMVFSTQIISALPPYHMHVAPTWSLRIPCTHRGFNTSLILELEVPSYPVHLSISSWNLTCSAVQYWYCREFKVFFWGVIQFIVLGWLPMLHIQFVLSMLAVLPCITVINLARWLARFSLPSMHTVCSHFVVFFRYWLFYDLWK